MPGNIQGADGVSGTGSSYMGKDRPKDERACLAQKMQSSDQTILNK
jgi:hypothetical protein